MSKVPIPKWGYKKIPREDFEKNFREHLTERLYDWLFIYRNDMTAATAAMMQMLFFTTDNNLNIIEQLKGDSDTIGMEYVRNRPKKT